MQMKMFLALRSAGVPEAEARSAADAVREEIRSAAQELKDGLATKGDVDQCKHEIIAVMERRFSDQMKWTVIVLFGGFGLFGTIVTLSKAF